MMPSLQPRGTGLPGGLNGTGTRWSGTRPGGITKTTGARGWCEGRRGGLGGGTFGAGSGSSWGRTGIGKATAVAPLRVLLAFLPWFLHLVGR
jgi:hypothetical protein